MQVFTASSAQLGDADFWLPADVLAMKDAQADFTAYVNREVPAGRCTGCEATGKLFRYGREILCGDCMDTQLDLMAQAVSQVIDLVPQADGSWAVAR